MRRIMIGFGCCMAAAALAQPPKIDPPELRPGGPPRAGETPPADKLPPRAMPFPGGLPLPPGMAFSPNFKLPFSDPAQERLTLLEYPEFQKELDLDADGKAALALLIDELKATGKKHAEDWEKLTPEQARTEAGKRLLARREEAAKLIEEGLGAKAKRMKEIVRQLDGIMPSLMDEEVRNALALAPEQHQAIGKGFAEAFKPGSFRPPALDPGAGPQDFHRKIQENMLKIQDGVVFAVLTDEQKKKWAELTGKKVGFGKPMPKFPGFGGGLLRPLGLPGNPAPPPAKPTTESVPETKK